MVITELNLTKSTVLNRFLCSKVKKKLGRDTSIENHSNSNNNKKTRTVTAQTLEEIFNVKPFDAYHLTAKYKSLCKVNSGTLKMNYEILKKNGITTETLLKYPLALGESNVDSKIRLLRKLPYNLNEVAALLNMPYSHLEEFVEQEISLGASNRISVMSQYLGITIQEICEYLCKKTFLQTMSLDKFKSSIKILTDFGVSLKEICADLWVLRYNDELIKNRLELAKEKQTENIKTWMVRAQPEIFENYIRRRSDNRSILGNSSLAEYLSERLDCSIDSANYFIVKHPPLRNKSLKKLQSLIDCLLVEGFKPHQICRVPKILVHSVDTTKKRLKYLEEKGIKIDSLHILTKSRKQFIQYIDLWMVKNKNKI